MNSPIRYALIAHINQQLHEEETDQRSRDSLAHYIVEASKKCYECANSQGNNPKLIDYL